MRSRLVVWSDLAAKRTAFPGQRWQDPEWIHRRICIYTALTLNSLHQQTDTDFDIVLGACEENRSIMAPYAKMLAGHGVNISYDEGRSFLEKLRQKYTYIDYLRVDSDDMYARTAIAHAKQAFELRDAIQFTDGVIWYLDEGSVYTWYHASPPFFGLRYPLEDLKTYRRMFHAMYGRKKHAGHTFFRRTYDPIIMPPGLFCVVAHPDNVSGQRKFGMETVPPDAILPHFGVRPEMWQNKDVPDLPRQ